MFTICHFFCKMGLRGVCGMTIQEIKLYLKNNKITYQELSEKSGIALNTLKNIFRGKTENPRIDTMQAIERALGLENEKTPTDDLSEGEKQLIALIKELTDEEAQEISNYVDFILSKRK